MPRLVMGGARHPHPQEYAVAVGLAYAVAVGLAYAVAVGQFKGDGIS